MTNELRPAAMLGVDAGGTKVTAGPVDVSGRMLAEPITEPSQTRDTASFVDGLIGTLRRAIREFGVAEGGVGPGGLTLGGLGMACAGTVDPVDGMVVASPNLPLHRVPLRDMLEKALGMPVVLENDANAAGSCRGDNRSGRRVAARGDGLPSVPASAGGSTSTADCIEEWAAGRGSWVI